MQRFYYILSFLFISTFYISCNSEDFSQTIRIGQEQVTNEEEEMEDQEMEDGEDEEGDPEPDTTQGAICSGGFADSYPCSNYDLISWMSTSTFSASEANDCWGWTDPETGKEYAIYCLNNGTAFIDISTPDLPVYVAKIFGNGSSSIWRDVKVYENHAYIVSESPGHGMQVFDMTQLRDFTDLPQLIPADMTYTGFGSAHNIVINEETGFAYAVGSDTFNGGVHFIDLSNPANPVASGGYSGGYTHDAQVIIYNGPDPDYTGKEIYIGSNESQVVFVDVTDKDNPQLISSITYNNVAYTHQGWFTEDHKYFIVGDEVDEINNGNLTKTIVLDASDLDNPQHHFDYLGTTEAIDHNGYIKGNTFYLANYTAGMRALDISNIENGQMTETGYFDVHPGDNSTNFDGAWSVYPYFESGNIVISDIVSGLFIVKAQ